MAYGFNDDKSLFDLDNISGNIATIETSSKASQAYSVGEYLVYNNQLYKVTTAIASGETLTVGTNISAVSIGDELTTLNSELILPNSSWIRWSNGSNVWYARKNGMVYLLLDSFPCTFASLGWTQLIAGNMPDGFKPSLNTRSSLYCSSASGSDGHSIMIEIRTSGVIYFLPAKAVSEYYLSGLIGFPVF